VPAWRWTGPACDVAETLRAYAGCVLLPGASGVRLLPDADDAPVAAYRHSYGEIAAIDPLELRDLAQAPTAVEVIYTDTSAIPWRDASAVAQLAGAGTTKPWRLSQVRMPGIHRYGQALREATERLNKLNLNDIATGLEVFDIGIRHDKGDIITVDHPLGLSMTPMRVVDVGMPAPGRWRLELGRHSAAAYSDIVASADAIQQAQRIVPAPAALGIKLNVSDFAGTLNYSEAYLHAVDANGNALDAPGFILVNGVATPVPNGALFTNRGPVAGYIVWDSAGPTFPKAGGLVFQPYALARRYQGQWQYDDNTTDWVTFTPAATHWIIGTLESGAPDTNSPPGLIAASIWAAASTLNSLEATADAAYDAAAAAQTTATGAATNASSALSTLATMRSNGYLDAAEKPALIKAYQAVYDEYPGIYGQGTSYGLTALRNAYESATDGLSGYLASLSPSWNDTTTDTPITPATDQATWAAYYSARQALLNAIAGEAGKRANWTQTSGRPISFRVGAVGNAASPPAGFATGLRNAETGAQVGNPVMRSYILVELSRAGAVVYTNSYDVFGVGELAAPDGTYRTASTLAGDLNYICDNRKGNLIVICSHDEPQGHRTDSGLPAAMYRCGASRAVFGSAAFEYRAAYILVGIAGCGEGNGAEVYAGAVNDDPNAWCELAFDLLDGQLRVSGTTSGARSLVDYGYTGSLDATRNSVTYSASAPSSPADGDIWIDTSVTPRTIRMRLGGAWQLAGTYVNGTAQLTDDAQLGLTAIWNGITGSGKPADNATRNVVTYSGSAPSSPVDGDLWVDTAGTYAVFKLRSGGVWITGANALSAYNNLSGKPVALADINTTESTKLSGIADNATRNPVYFQDSDPGSVPDGSIWISSTKAWQRVSGAWQPYVGNGSVGTGQLADAAATVVSIVTLTAISHSNIS
jgi:hypothetical protein